MKLNTFFIKIFTPVKKFFSFLENIFRKRFNSCVLVTVFIRTTIRKIYSILEDFFCKRFFNNKKVYNFFQNPKNCFTTTDLYNITFFPIWFNAFMCIYLSATEKFLNFLKDFSISIGKIYDWTITDRSLSISFIWITPYNRKTTIGIEKSSDITFVNHWYYYNTYYNKTKGGVQI